MAAELHLGSAMATFGGAGFCVMRLVVALTIFLATVPEMDVKKDQSENSMSRKCTTWDELDGDTTQALVGVHGAMEDEYSRT